MRGSSERSPGDQSLDLAASNERLEPGTRAGEYAIGRVLGSGGFGTVYEAENPLIARRAAIKVLARRHCADPRAVSRFLAEARIVNQVRHPNIVDITAFGQLEDGRHYHVMEYLEGETLEKVLARRGRLSLTEAVPLLAGIASALDAAHQRSIAHRDLKPANIFVVDRGGVLTAKVIDFGIAKLYADEDGAPGTQSGALLGTPRYMSPEQARGKAVDYRTDIYAFGLVVYEILTGAPPFQGNDQLEILLKRTSEQPEAPSKRCGALPADVDVVILALLAREPEDRPRRLAPVVRLLERASRGEPVDAADLVVEGGAEGGPAVAVFDGTAVHEDTLTLDPPRSPALADTSVAPARDLRSRAPSWRVPLGVGTVTVLAVVVAWTLRSTSSEAPATLGGVPTAAVPAPVVTTAPTPEVNREPAAAGEAPQRTRVVLSFEGAPARTNVLDAAGVVLGEAPGSLEVERGTEPLALTFRRSGYQDRVLAITPSESQTVRVEMRHVSVARRRPPGPDDSENPFR